MINLQMIEETPDEYILTSQGKAFINNIYFMMLDKTEQEEIEGQLKILRLQ
jgi:predicted transcriptional regulator